VTAKLANWSQFECEEQCQPDLSTRRSQRRCQYGTTSTLENSERAMRIWSEAAKKLATVFSCTNVRSHLAACLRTNHVSPRHCLCLPIEPRARIRLFVQCRPIATLLKVPWKLISSLPSESSGAVVVTVCALPRRRASVVIIGTASGHCGTCSLGVLPIIGQQLCMLGTAKSTELGIDVFWVYLHAAKHAEFLWWRRRL